MSYRMDHRSPEDFANDIKKCVAIEHKLMESYVKDLSARKGGIYKFRPSNSQADGEFIPSGKKVSSEADFWLITPSGEERRIEVKFCRDDRKDFRIKVSQLRSYIKQDCCIVTYMGVNTPNPKYTVLTPLDLSSLAERYPDEYFHPWKKDVKRILSQDCVWWSVAAI